MFVGDRTTASTSLAGAAAVVTYMIAVNGRESIKQILCVLLTCSTAFVQWYIFAA